MANQGNQRQQPKDQPTDPHKPTGTSGRQSGNDMGDNSDLRRNDQTTGGGGRRTPDEDEESGLGNRTTNR